MKPIRLSAIATSALLLTLSAATGCTTTETTRTSPGEVGRLPREVDADDVNRMIRRWPDPSREAAQEMMNKYATPDGVTTHMLVWENNGPWLRTIVYRETIDHNFPMPHEDCLEQFIKYEVPVDRFEDLAEFDGSVIAERTAGWLSARCDKEAMNILALNLAHRIVEGEITVEQAREEYAQVAEAYKDGERPAITQRLQFTIPRRDTGDPDTAEN